MKRVLCALLALLLCTVSLSALCEGKEQEAPPTAGAAPCPEEPAPTSPAAAGGKEEQDSREKPEGEPKEEPTPAPEDSTPVPEPTAPPTAEAGPLPDDPDPGEQTVSPEDGPTASPSDPTADAPTEDPSPSPGDSPSPEASAGASASPEPGPSPEGTEQPGGTGTSEAYMQTEAGRREGSLAELLATAGEKTIWLRIRTPVTLEDFPLALLRGVTLLPDPETWPGDDHVVTLRADGAELLPGAIGEAGDERVSLVLAVEPKPEPEATHNPEEPALSVAALNYESGHWLNWSPEFLLSGIPAEAEGYTYVAIIYDERFIPLSSDSYLPMEEGIYNLRFAILNPQGDVVDSSQRYELMLDLTAPQLRIEVSDSLDYTMSLSANDLPGNATFPLDGSAATAVSGVTEFSLDGGASWTPLGEGESVIHTAAKRKAFPPRTILVRDLAGNVRANEEKVVLDKLPGLPSVGGGVASPTAPPHASGEGDTTPFGAYELALPEEPVAALTLGDELVDLNLQIDGLGTGLFTESLTSWGKPAAQGEEETGSEGDEAEEEPRRDTLLLRAEDGAGAACTWHINGAVLRKLYNSDIDYLALSVGDAVFSLPTVGFTAGTRYAQLKMAGTSTAEFAYEVVMRPAAADLPAQTSWNLSPDWEAELWVSVGEERFQMLDRLQSPEMYPYDVYCAPTDLLDYPYGAYPAAAQAVR